MQKSDELDIEYFISTIEKLKAEIVTRCNLSDGMALVVKEYLGYAYVVGYEEGHISRSGARRIEQLDVNGVVIKEYRSIKIAALRLGVSQGSIQDSLRHRNRRCRGFKFRFKKVIE